MCEQIVDRRRAGFVRKSRRGFRLFGNGLFVTAAVLACFAALAPAAPAEAGPGWIPPEAGILREASEICDVLYPDRPAPEEVRLYVASCLEAVHGAEAAVMLARGRFEEAASSFASAVKGTGWDYSTMDVMRELVRYKTPSASSLDGWVSRFPSAELEGRVMERLRSSLAASAGSLDSVRFASFHGWLVEHRGDWRALLGKADPHSVDWFSIEPGPSLKASSLFSYAASLAAGGASTGGTLEAVLRPMAVDGLGRRCCLLLLGEVAAACRKRMLATLRGSELVVRGRVVSAASGRPVAEAIVSFGGGLVGTVQTGADGRFSFSVDFERLALMDQGAGWQSLGGVKGRESLFFLNLNVNDLLASARKEAGVQGVRRFVWSSSDIEAAVPEGAMKLVIHGGCVLGRRIARVRVLVPGREPFFVEPERQKTVDGLWPGRYFLSFEGRSEGDLIICRKAMLVEVPASGEPVEVDVRMPCGTVEVPAKASIETCVSLFVRAKEELLAGRMDVKEFRRVMGRIYRAARAGLDKRRARETMRRFSARIKKIVKGLYYKSKARRYDERIRQMQARLDELKEELPDDLTGPDYVNSFSRMLELYSVEPFRLTAGGYRFLADYRKSIEVASTNREHLAAFMERMDRELSSRLKEIEKDLFALLEEYVSSYQLARYTCETGYDHQIAAMLADSYLPLERLVRYCSILGHNGFLSYYDAQTRYLKRLYENRKRRLTGLRDTLVRLKEQYDGFRQGRFPSLRGEYEELRRRGLPPQVLAGLKTLRHFAARDLRIGERDRDVYFSIVRDRLSEAAAAAEKDGAGPAPGGAARREPVVRFICVLPELFDWGTRAADLDATARAMWKRYTDLLRSRLIELMDVSMSDERMAAFVSLDRFERKKRMNAVTGELSRKWALPEPVPVEGLDVPAMWEGERAALAVVCAFVADGLAMELEAREARPMLDSQCGRLRSLLSSPRLPDSAEVAPLAGELGRLVPVVGRDDGKGNLRHPRWKEWVHPSLRPSMEEWRRLWRSLLARVRGAGSAGATSSAGARPLSELEMVVERAVPLLERLGVGSGGEGTAPAAGRGGAGEVRSGKEDR